LLSGPDGKDQAWVRRILVLFRISFVDRERRFELTMGRMAGRAAILSIRAAHPAFGRFPIAWPCQHDHDLRVTSNAIGKTQANLQP
jgi:hypothetical protein